jgi:hypothetical protein
MEPAPFWWLCRRRGQRQAGKFGTFSVPHRSPADAMLKSVESYCETPHRDSLHAVPTTDPLIYRFYELVQTYNTTWKALIEEEFGDGTMSAINFDMKIEREENPKGDRVRVTMSGKFFHTNATGLHSVVF